MEFRFVLLADSSGVAVTKEDQGYAIADVLRAKENGQKVQSLPGFQSTLSV